MKRPQVRRPGRTGWVVGGAVAVVAIVVAGVVGLTADGSAAGGPTTAAVSSAAGSPSATAARTGGTLPSVTVPTTSSAPTTVTDVNAPPAELTPVPLTATATEGNGIQASLTSLTAIQGTATGPGQINGPSLQVTVRLANGTARPVDLGGVAVDMSYGSDRTPASPLEDTSAAPFTGTLAPGRVAEAVYVFRVPEDQRQSVTVQVGYAAGAPLLVFTGAVR